MVEFGKQLESSKREGWYDNYIDYDRLKKIIKKSHKNNKNKNKKALVRTASAAEVLDFTIQKNAPTNSNSNNNNNNNNYAVEFRHALDQEIEKVVLFLLQQQGRIAEELSRLAKERIQCVEEVSILLQDYYCYQNPNDFIPILSPLPAWRCLDENCNGYRAVSRQVLEFVAFVELNVTAVRKILKKHDKNSALLEEEEKRQNKYKYKLLSRQYLSNFTKAVDSHLDQLYNYGGVSALVVTLNRAFGELHQMELFLLMMQQEANKPSHRRAKSVPVALSSTSYEDDDNDNDNDNDDMDRETEMEGLLRMGAARQESSMPLERTSSATITLVNQPPQHFQCEITSQREPLLEKINAARRRLQHSTKYVQVVAAQALMFEGDDNDDDDEREDQYEDIGDGATKKAREMTRSQKISAFLNLCSTFLYMTNYYIVAPTTGQYALRLGSSEAMAGIIIGMTPNAALLATILYGWWSNYSYKSALLFAACSSCIGNVFYAMALYYNSLFFVMTGRFFNGFGSARSINRRFIADTFSRSERTPASAAFVTAGALGMAAGPAIAAFLARVEFATPGGDNDDNQNQNNNLLWTVETAPGWVMLGLWSIFLVSAFVWFEEPDRSHLFGGGDTNKQTTKAYLELPVTTSSTTNGETAPLLESKNGAANRSEIEMFMKVGVKDEPPLYTNAPVMMTMWIYFILKLVLECLLSSCATLTSFYFGWDAQHSGSFMAFLGLLMFPANMVVARLSHRYEDRELIYVTLIVMFFSVMGIIAYQPSQYSATQYMIFGICVFLSTNILEGPNMSLLSKTIPRSWAKGTFNSGFLATEAGTAARSVGDILISVAAGLAGFSHLLDATFIPLAVLVIGSILLTRRYFDQMIEEDDDDDDSRKSDPPSYSRQTSLRDD